MENRPTTLAKILGVVWYLLVCMVFLAVGSLYGWASRSKLLTSMLDPFHRPPPPREAFKSDVQTFLVLGCDEDVYYQSQFVMKHKARSDMMLVCRLDFNSNEITGVSIPRDTWCQLPGYSMHKINAYHSIAKFGQADELTKQAVEYLIGVRIDKVLTVDYDAFQKLVDLVGGVNVNVSKPMDYDDTAGKLHIHLKPGRHTLNGYDAMCYVRYRHSNKGRADTDFQRQDRQKDFLIGFKEAIFRNKLGLPEIAEASKAVLGGALTDDQILSLAFFTRGVNQSRIKLGVIPTREDGNGLALDTAKLPQVLAEFKLSDQGSRVSFR